MKGVRVAAQVEKSPEAIFLNLACLRIGAICLPLNAAYKVSEVAYLLGDAEPKAVVCRPSSEEAMREIAIQTGVAEVLTLGQESNGSGMLFLNRFDAATMIRLMPRSTVMMDVPTFCTRLLAEADFTAEPCRNMRLFISGSAPLLEETFTHFEGHTDHSILERYGMTETNINTSNPLDGNRRAGTAGFPLPDVEVRIADEDGKILDQRATGVLEVKGPNVFQGYWRMPEKTASEFRPDGFFITGDVARIDERGYIQIVGHAKDLIISGGFNVDSKKIELCVDAIEGVGESAVIGLPHPDFGEAVVAVVTRKNGVGLEAQKIIDAVKGDLANFQVPKKIMFLEELPRSAMGKMQKNVLRENYKDSFTG